jgi:hypothetical protein
MNLVLLFRLGKESTQTFNTMLTMARENQAYLQSAWNHSLLPQLITDIMKVRSIANRITVHSTFFAVAIVYASIATPIVLLYHCSLSHEANTANRDGVLQSDRIRMSNHPHRYQPV